MLFNSQEYVVFLIVVFVLFWLVSQHRTLRLLLLLAASYLFYASWSPHYLLLIILSSGIDYLVGLGFHRWPVRAEASGPTTRIRKALLCTSLISNLGILGIFKYFNFFSDAYDSVVLSLGLAPPSLRLDVLLPVGISFYTFQTMSYSIDLYRGRIEPCRNPLNFFVYVAFFPQLVAGPIVRAVDFLHQLNERPSLSTKQFGQGVALIMFGLIKKVAIGDYLAVNLVDRVFDTPHMFSSLETLMGVYGYAMQIYCDFSGYTDVAIGSALLFGFTLPENFQRPYKAYSLQDFWRRWHISLSSWLRDYLYISLGGSHRGRFRTYANLLITMLLGGLWHGAAWNFVLWGALHGGVLALTRAWQRASKDRGWALGPWAKPLGIFLTFHFVCFTWIFFRSPSMEGALEILSSLGQLTFTGANLGGSVLLALAAGFGAHLSPDSWKTEAISFFGRPQLWSRLLVVAIVFVLREIATSQVVPFIYFQF